MVEVEVVEVAAINEQMNELDLTLLILIVIFIKKLKMIVFLPEVVVAAEVGEEEAVSDDRNMLAGLL